MGTAKPGRAGEGNLVGLENLLAEARGEYDQIILGAPSSDDADATRVVRSSDVTVMVLDETYLQKKPAADACARLRSLSRSPLAALLLTRT